MKTYFITVIYIVFACAFSNAQEAPTPPTPPSTSSVSKSSTQTESTSISISYTDEDYKLRARFPKNRYEKLKALIQNELGGKNMDIGKGYSKWSNDEKVYYIKLTEKSLRISLDLTVASPELADKFSEMGKDIKMIVSGTNANDERVRMQREADRMRSEADRMQREAERLELQVKRDAKRIQREKQRVKKEAEREIQRMAREEKRLAQRVEMEAKRVERDAKRIEMEAKRLDREAKRFEERARHKGGVSRSIKNLLNDSKTLYSGNSKSYNNWIWPAIQDRLIEKLKADKLVSSADDITFTSERDRLYVNGEQLSERQNESYRKMLMDAGIQPSSDFSFYKQGNHIVVIGLNAKIKKFFTDIHSKGFISSTDEAVKIFINGNSVVQNGTDLSADKVATYNAILAENGIIPAPGKYIEMKKAGSYRLGYSLGKNGIIGTWIEED
ncbi:hypothetical protein [uncultured Kordia sp.]|uniref:hypothetical protein n=1 Tax=uncultured Kordia sp. TaxID=507699 RepID=UPI0026102CE6|nr:hypothetical protein [uncultured Kordia sp.]